MLIKSLKLHNIRSYKDEEIDFPNGSILLSGDIGSGKSTILLAIEFALFGTDTERVSGAALLRQGASEGSVQLTFEVEEKEFIIIRCLKKAKDAIAQTPGTIIADGKHRELMPVELKSEMINLLGYPEELATKKRNLIYSYTVYCPQEQMKAILSDQAESRLDTLRKIFGIDKYKRIRENMVILGRELKTKQREMEAQIEDLERKKSDLEQKKERAKQADDVLAGLTSFLQQLEEELKTKRSDLQKTEQEVKALQEERRMLSILEAKLKLKQESKQKNEERVNIINIRIEQLKVTGDIPQLQQEIEQREQDIRSLLSKKSTIKQLLESTNERSADLEKETAVNLSTEIEEKNIRLHELTLEIRKKESIIQQKEKLEQKEKETAALLREYEVKKREAEENRKNILQLAVCPLCLQTVSKEHKEKVHDKEEEKEQLYKKKSDEAQESLKIIINNLKDIKKEMDYIGELEKRSAALQSDIAHLQTKHQLYEQKKKLLGEIRIKQQQINEELKIINSRSAETEIAELKKLKEQWEKLREKQRIESELQELRNSNSQLCEELKEMETEKVLSRTRIGENAETEERWKTQQMQLEKLQSEERERLIHRTALFTEKQGLEEMIEALKKEIAEKEKIKSKSGDLKRLLHWTEEYFMNLMSTIEKQVMTRIYYEFNELFRNWFSMLIADENMSARVDDSFNPLIQQNGYEIDVIHLSGGERTSVALAYRLALNKVVNDVIQKIKTKDIIMLDEPTEGFSTEQLDRVREVLSQLNVKQAIIVSHENKIESFVDSVIKIGKEEGMSKVFG